MQQAEVVQHLQQSVAAEQAAIHAQYDMLVAENPGLRRFGEALELINDNEFQPSQTCPRPSALLLHKAFRDIDKAGQEHGPDVQFIGEHVLPLTGLAPEPGTQQIVLESRGARAACPNTEIFFNDARQQIEDGGGRSQKEIYVYHDEAGTPLLFRKAWESNSALTLAPLEVGGLRVPPGTVVAVIGAKVRAPMRRRYVRGGAGIVGTFTAPEELETVPIRLSAWAYADPRDRALFACEGSLNVAEELEYDTTRADMVATVSLDDYRAAAHKVMDLCAEVAKEPAT